MQTVISVFDDLGAAQRAVHRLVEAGFDRNEMHLEGAPAVTPEPTVTLDSSYHTGAGSGEADSGLLGRLGAMLARDADNDAQVRHRSYTEALRSGHTLVLVEVEDAAHAQQACLLLGACGAQHVHAESGSSAHV